MMRALGIVCGLIAGFGPAWAEENDLSDGVLIAHHVSSLTYIGDVTDWGAAYSPHAIDNSWDQVNRIDGPRSGAIWYVLAAWPKSKIWKGCECGLANYDAGLFEIANCGPCFVGPGGIEIATSEWPGPNQGTAIVSTSACWTGSLIPIYWFAGYLYGSAQGSAVMQIDVNPASQVIEFTKCAAPSRTFAVMPGNCGAMGLNAEGVAVHPMVDDPERVCCDPVTYECVLLTEADCLAQGGEWNEDLGSCASDPCGPVGVCCWGTLFIQCTLLREGECLTRPHLVHGMGVWHGPAIDCDPYPCMTLPRRVCCQTDNTCVILNELECGAAGGNWLEEQDSCDPIDPCSTPIQPTSWGKIKSLYR